MFVFVARVFSFATKIFEIVKALLVVCKTWTSVTVCNFHKTSWHIILLLVLWCASLAAFVFDDPINFLVLLCIFLQVSGITLWKFFFHTFTLFSSSKKCCLLVLLWLDLYVFQEIFWTTVTVFLRRSVCALSAFHSSSVFVLWSSIININISWFSFCHAWEAVSDHYVGLYIKWELAIAFC